MEQHLLPVSLLAGALACAPALDRAPPEPPLTPASGERREGALARPQRKLVSTTSVPDGAGNEPAQPLAPEASSEQESSAEPTPELPRGTLVLHVGDSFAGSLGVPLGRRLKAAGLRSVLEYKTSSYIPQWASEPELTHYVVRYSPDLVLITLGANEFELSVPELRAGAIRRLVKRLEGRPCVWITPPRWKRDTGIIDVIVANAAPCRVLDTDAIVHDLPRKKDKIHPSDDARETWADAVLTWLAEARKSGAERPWELREE